MGYSCGHKPYAGVCCVECRPDLFFNAAGFPTAYSPAPTLTPYVPDPRDARIAELEAERLPHMCRMDHPTVRFEDPEERFAEPYNCPWCEVVRLEALIVSTVEAAAGIDADLHAEYDRIKAKP